MEIVSKQPCCDNVIELLDWMNVSSSFVLVMEQPMPCMDLQKFCQSHTNCQLPEYTAREVMRQLVQAVWYCFDCGVLHEDIRPLNILVKTDTLEVKLIDFGCARRLETSKTFEGQFREVMEHNQRLCKCIDHVADGCLSFSTMNHGFSLSISAYVWNLGVLLLVMITEETSFNHVHIAVNFCSSIVSKGKKIIYNSDT